MLGIRFLQEVSRRTLQQSSAPTSFCPSSYGMGRQGVSRNSRMRVKPGATREVISSSLLAYPGRNACRSRSEMPGLIEDYAIIGNCESAALVGRDGSIDWLALPRFDSAACFAALLGDAENGRWKIAPKGVARITRGY